MFVRDSGATVELFAYVAVGGTVDAVVPVAGVVRALVVQALAAPFDKRDRPPTQVPHEGNDLVVIESLGAGPSWGYGRQRSWRWWCCSKYIVGQAGVLEAANSNSFPSRDVEPLPRDGGSRDRSV